MKNSAKFKMAQAAVLKCEGIFPDDKLEILRELMHEEDLAKFVESKEEAQNG